MSDQVASRPCAVPGPGVGPGVGVFFAFFGVFPVNACHPWSIQWLDQGSVQWSQADHGSDPLVRPMVEDTVTLQLGVPTNGRMGWATTGHPRKSGFFSFFRFPGTNGRTRCWTSPKSYASEDFPTNQWLDPLVQPMVGRGVRHPVLPEIGVEINGWTGCWTPGWTIGFRLFRRFRAWIPGTDHWSDR